MIARLRHRGPDQSGLFIAGSVGFAHTRLKIVDLTGGNQPMSDPSGQVTLIYNGEAWNYRALRQTLERRGHRFTSRSDTEVVLQAYLEYGERFLEHVDGMFALAIWDSRANRLILARDRVGKKPLYYTMTSAGDIVFASEIKAMFCDSRVRPEVDPQALADYLVLRYVPAPATMFSGIFKLPPATILVAERDEVFQRSYWELPGRRTCFVPRRTTELGAMLRGAIGDAVKARLMSDVPVGALLSGGVDSSILVAEASRLVDSPLKTFSVRFVDAPPAFDESPYARYVAQAFHTEHHETSVGERAMLEALPAVAWHRDEPISEPAEVPTFLICAAARPHATVLLSGEGGDELFAGYAKYAYDWLAKYVALAPGWLRGAARGGVDRIPPKYRRAATAARSVLEPDEARRWATWFGAFTDDEKPGILSDGFRGRVAHRETARIYRSRLSGVAIGDALTRALYADAGIWLPDNLLMKADRMSMAASTEARMPFLDVQLIKFQVPIGAWLRSDRFAFLRGVLTSDRALGRGIFRPESIVRLVGEHLSGAANHQTKLFALLAVELWHRIHLDQSLDSAPSWQAILDAGELEIKE